MIPIIDLVVLTRDAGPLHPDVERAFRSQRAVQLAVHRVAGSPRAEDCCRWESIARARNTGKLYGSAPWLMFLDDDVVLEPRCIATLVKELNRRPAFAALAADYLGERRTGRIASHVSMGAALFRREALQLFRFTWRNKKCECQCCCDDLRRLHWAIDYCDAARARHLPKDAFHKDCRPIDAISCHATSKPASGHVLTAFNRRDWRLFRARFMTSLRATGNEEPVLPLALGLYPSERLQLLDITGVRSLFRPDDGRFVPRQRLTGFQHVLRAMPPDAIVAYWDAGDVIFQARLQPLWEIVRRHPGKLLVAREPASHPESPTIAAWTRDIADSTSRREVRRLLYSSPWLNGGFVAGNVAALLKYFRTVANWYDSPRLAGSKNKGDQLALNVYCHSHPDAWHEVAESWNYCLCRRDPTTVYRSENGRYVDVRGVPVYVVHGNGQKLNTVAICRKAFGARSALP